MEKYGLTSPLGGKPHKSQMDQVLTCYGELSANGQIIKIKFYLAFVAPAEQIHLPSEIDFAM